MTTSPHSYNIYLTIAKNIRKYRKKQKMTQKDLAIRSGYSYAYIRRIEGPKCLKNFSILTLYNISKALKIDIKCLFENEDI